MLDEHTVYLSLGVDSLTRFQRYQAFVQQGFSVKEAQFIRDSVKRNQLTGNTRFVDEVEQRVGIRVERRKQGRPVRKSE